MKGAYTVRFKEGPTGRLREITREAHSYTEALEIIENDYNVMEVLNIEIQSSPTNALRVAEINLRHKFGGNIQVILSVEDDGDIQSQVDAYLTMIRNSLKVADWKIVK